MRDEVIYRCVNRSCARALPRKVNYCPYCGIDQATAAPRPVPPRAGPAWQGETFAPEPIVTAAPEATAHPAPPRPAAAPQAAVPPAAPRPGVTATIADKAAPPPGPPQRRPVRLRWIALVLAVLWLAWLVQRPGGPAGQSRLDTRIDRAVAMARACKANEAQAELIAMQGKATQAQLARLQTALDDADQSCRKGARGRSGARAGAAQSQSVRNLLADGRSAFARGDYRAAADKMEVCVTMVDADTKECAALKARAERYDGERRRCLARAGDWVGERCQ